jgi:hypothetical protein
MKGKRNSRAIAGLLMAAGAGVGALFVLTDFRIPAPMFAVVTWYAEPRFFTLIQNNIADELALTGLLVGAFWCAFQPGAPVACDSDNACNAMYRALKWNTAFLLFAVLFLYGKAFLAVMVVNLFSTPMAFGLIRHLSPRRADSGREPG